MKGFLAIEPELCWRITLTLLHVGWIGLGIAVLAAVGGRLWGRSAPERRYWLNLAALGVLGLSLPATFVFVGREVVVPRVAPPRVQVEPRERPALAVALVPIEPRRDARPMPRLERDVEAPRQVEAAAGWSMPQPRAVAPYVVLLYAAGVVVMLARLALAVGGGMRLRKSAEVVLEGSLAELVASQGRRLAMRTAPKVGLCVRVATPVVLGLLRPMILLPAVMATGLSTQELAVILAHELAHLRRFDHVFILIQRALEAVLFFHPVAWWLSRRVDREREHCCDDLVVRAGHERLLYANALLRVAELCLAGGDLRLVAPALDGRRRSALQRRRIERLLNVADEPAVKLNRPGALALVLLVGFAGSTAAAFLSVRDEPRPAEAQSRDVPAEKAEGPATPARSSVVGRLVDAQGKPLPFVTVGMIQKDLYAMPPFWDSLLKWTRTDVQGRFTMPAVPPGDYQVLPVSGIEIIGKSTPAEQIPAELRKYADQPGRHRLPRPLPGAFPAVNVQVGADGKPAVLEIKAVPHVTFTARFIDGAGKPAKARPDAYPIYGTLNGERSDWQGWFDFVPDKPDTMTAAVPAALKEFWIQDDLDNVWWTWAPGTPRVSHHGIRSKKTEGDRLDIIVQRLKSNSLEIRLSATAGKLPDKPDISVFYPTLFRGEGGQIPNRVAEGVYRLNAMILPERACEVVVSADGFKTTSTKSFQFREEGQAGVVEVTLTPGVRTNSWRKADAQPVVLKTPEDQPIPQPVEEKGPDRAIACRAVDRDTGKPVADAVVKVEVERRVKEDKDEEYRMIDRRDERTTKTDADGRFSVLISEKAIADRTPLATMQVTVTIRHAKYVSSWAAVDVSELAKKPISDTFPEFRAVKLTPGRRISGRLVGPDGKPLKNAQIYQKQPILTSEMFIPDLPKTDETGRFAFNAPVGAALHVEFRAWRSARKFHEVPADKTDLGDIRIAPGIEVSGRVLDGRGAPVALLSVTTPAVPDPESQPNFVQTTDRNGRFQTGELPPGRYRAVVGDFYHDEEGKNSMMAIRHAPDLYLPVPFEVRENEPAPELTLRPVPHVTFVAKLITTQPAPKPREGNGQAHNLSELLQVWAQHAAILEVKGTYEGSPWESQLAWDLDFSDEGKTCTVRVPKGLVNARLEFGGAVQRFRLGPEAPVLFGSAYRLGRADSDLRTITLWQYRATALKITLRSPDGKPAAAPKFEVHYVREPDMRANGVIFDTPPLQTAVQGGTVQVAVLPDEEIVLTVPGSAPVRVKLSEGETRAVTRTVPTRK